MDASSILAGEIYRKINKLSILFFEMKSFNEKCYAILKKVPAGKVTTYEALARTVGNPRAARAVGNAMNRNPYAPKVPCHRVVKSDGKIGGFALGVKKKIEMLKREGILIENGKVDLERFGFTKV